MSLSLICSFYQIKKKIKTKNLQWRDRAFPSLSLQDKNQIHTKNPYHPPQTQNHPQNSKKSNLFSNPSVVQLQFNQPNTVLHSTWTLANGKDWVIGCEMELRFFGLCLILDWDFWCLSVWFGYRYVWLLKFCSFCYWNWSKMKVLFGLSKFMVFGVKKTQEKWKKEKKKMKERK